MLLLAVVGCANRNVSRTFPTRTPDPFSASGELEMPDRWWTSFDDLGLNAQIDQSLAGNFTLAAALQRLNASRAVVRREASDLWPDVDGVVDIQSGFGPGEDITSTVMGFDTAYQVDLWGQIRSRVDAER